MIQGKPNFKFDKQWIEPALYQAAEEIVKQLHRHGHTAYFAGGCVRDALLKIPVEKDIDIATDARPEKIQAIFPNTRAVGAHFGVVLVENAGIQFEVATFRTDLSYSDGRRPDAVIFSCPLEDARRRDFTVNGLFYDPIANNLIDYVSGAADLKNSILRAIGSPEQRFKEDHLRLLRAVRFAAALGLRIHPETWQAMVNKSALIQKVSMERISAEISRMLTRKGADAALDLMHTSGLLVEIIPEVSAIIGIPQPPAFHPEGDVFHHVKLMFRSAQFPISDTLAMAILLHDIGKAPTFRFDRHADIGADMAHNIMIRLKFSKEKIHQVWQLVKYHLRFMHVHQMRNSTLKKFLRIENFPIHLELHRLDCVASHGILDNYTFCLKKLDEFGQDTLSPKPLITGRHLISLGFEPGPIFKTILSDIENRQLENKITNPEDALTYVKEKYSP